MRLLISGLAMWAFVSGCLYVLGRLNNKDRAGVGKALFFGLVSAVITGALIGSLVMFF